MTEYENNTNKTTKSPDSSKSADSGHQAPPPKSFWWRALLMMAVALFLFSNIREMAKGQQSGPWSLALLASELTPPAPETPGSTLGTEGAITVANTPSLPPAKTPPPVAGYYISPYLPSHTYTSRQTHGTTPAPNYPPPQGPYAPPHQYPHYWYSPQSPGITP